MSYGVWCTQRSGVESLWDVGQACEQSHATSHTSLAPARFLRLTLVEDDRERCRDRQMIHSHQ